MREDFKNYLVKEMIESDFWHFSAGDMKEVARGYAKHIEGGGKMLLAMAGAMSTARLGITLAEMIRKDKVHAISTTGANLEEDIFRLVAHDHYVDVPNYRSMVLKDEEALLKKGLNRVTDVCIPEHEAMRRIESHLLDFWRQADKERKSFLPYEFMYQLLRSGRLKEHYQYDPKDSWVLAASEKAIPIYTPGWEDSTLGNVFVAANVRGDVKDLNTVKDGKHAMRHLIEWYRQNSRDSSIGFFQIGGGIAGDFPICAVPLMEQDLKIKCKKWGCFYQINNSPTAHGSYSGAPGREKITWGKLEASTPQRSVEHNDATIAAPLIFRYVLGSDPSVRKAVEGRLEKILTSL